MLANLSVSMGLPFELSLHGLKPLFISYLLSFDADALSKELVCPEQRNIHAV